MELDLSDLIFFTIVCTVVALAIGFVAVLAFLGGAVVVGFVLTGAALVFVALMVAMYFNY